MGLSTSELYIVLRARDEASRVMRGFAGTLTGMSAAAMAAQQAAYARGQALATAGVAVAAAGAVGLYALNKMTDAAMEYNQQVSLTLTQVDKANVSFKELYDMGLDLAQTLPVPFEEIQPALYDIFSSIDTNAPGAALLLKNIGKAAVGGQTDMQTVTRATISILNAYKMKAEDVTHVNDVMFQLVRKGVGTYEEFTSVIGRGIPSAVKAGQSVEDLAGMMAFLTRNGMSAAMASTSAARALDTLSKPAAVQNLHQLGVEVYDSTGKFRPMVDIMQDLKAKLDNLAPAARAATLNEIFKGSGANIQAMRFLNLAIEDTTGLLPEMTRAMHDAGGAAQEAFDIMSQTPEAKMQMLNNQYQTMSVIVGNRLLPAKLKLIEMLSNILGWFNRLSPETQKWIAIILGAVSALTLLSGIIMIVAGGLTALKAALTMMGITATSVRQAIIGIGTALRGMTASAGAIGLAITAAAAAVAFFIGRSSEGKHATEGWTDALYDQNGALVENARALVAKAVAEESAFNNLSQFGITTATVTDALMGNKAALESMNNAMNNTIEAAKTSGNSVMENADAVMNARDAAEAIHGAFNTMNNDMDGSAANARQLAEALVGTGGTMDKAAGDAGNLDGSLSELITTVKKLQALLSQSAAMDKYRQDLADIDKIVKENGKSLDEHTTKGRLNRDALRGMFSDTATAAQLWGERYGKTTEEIDNKTADMMAKLKTKLIAEGFDAKDIKNFMKGFDILPSQLRTVTSEAGTTLNAGMNAAGAMAGPGLAAGIAKGNPAVIGAINKMTALAIQEARAGLQTHSPSRVFFEIGTDTVQGYIDGVRSKDTEVVTLSLKLGRDVVQEYIKGMGEKGADAKKQARATLINNVQQAYQEGLDELKAKLQTARAYVMEWRNQLIGLLNMNTAFKLAQDKDAAEADALEKLTKAQEDYNKAKEDGSQSSIDASAKVLAAAQETYRAAAAAAATSWVDEFRNQLAQASNFINLLNQLKASGAHEMLIQQIAAAGPEAGSAMAQDLINGGAAGTGGLIDEFNASFTAFDKSATALGVDFANSWALATGPKMGGLTAAMTLKAFKEQFGPGGPGREKLMRTMDNLANDLARTVSVTVNLSNKGLPGRALGGPVTANTPYWVGENGPEVFVPGASGRIIPNSKTGSVGGGGQVINQDITIYTQEIDPAKHAADLGWEFASKVRA